MKMCKTCYYNILEIVNEGYTEGCTGSNKIKWFCNNPESEFYGSQTKDEDVCDKWKECI